MKEDVWVVLAEGCVDRRDNTGDETSTTATPVLVVVYADHHQALRKMGYFQFTKDDGRDLHIHTCMGIEIPHRAPPSLQFIWRATFWTTDCSRFSFERVFCNKTCNEKKCVICFEQLYGEKCIWMTWDAIGFSPQQSFLTAAYRSARWLPPKMITTCTHEATTSFYGW